MIRGWALVQKFSKRITDTILVVVDDVVVVVDVVVGVVVDVVVDVVKEIVLWQQYSRNVCLYLIAKCFL